MFKFSWEIPFWKGDIIQEFSKLLKISCLQVMKSKLTIVPSCLTCLTHTCQLCIPTIVEVSLKIFFWYGNLHVRVFSTYKTGIVTTLNDFATFHTGTGRCCKNVCIAFSYVHVSFPKNLV